MDFTEEDKLKIHDNSRDFARLDKEFQKRNSEYIVLNEKHDKLDRKLDDVSRDVQGLTKSLNDYLAKNIEKEKEQEKRIEANEDAITKISDGELKVLANNDTKQWALLILLIGGLMSSIWFLNRKPIEEKLAGVFRTRDAYAQTR